MGREWVSYLRRWASKSSASTIACASLVGMPSSSSKARTRSSYVCSSMAHMLPPGSVMVMALPSASVAVWKRHALPSPPNGWDMDGTGCNRCGQHGMFGGPPCERMTGIRRC